MIHAHALTVGHMAETTCLMDVSHTASIGLRASGLSDNLRTPAQDADCHICCHSHGAMAKQCSEFVSHTGHAIIQGQAAELHHMLMREGRT